jgi:hypothetical protein
MSLSGQGDMRDTAFDTGVFIADAVALAELPGGTGHEQVRTDWLHERLAAAPGSWHDFRRLDRRERGTRGRHTRGRPRLLRGRGHARPERIRAASIAVGARQLRAVLAELLD